MAQIGMALQSVTLELVDGIEAMRRKLYDISDDIEYEENTKVELESMLNAIKSRLDEVETNLKRKYQLHKKYELAVKESESDFNKIVESSEKLLSKIKRESGMS